MFFVEFEGSNCVRYTNAQHVAYHSAIVEELALVGNPENLHLDEARMDSYEDVVSELRDRNKVAQADVKTLDIGMHDSERDRYASMLFYLITSNLQSTDADEKAAAQLLEVAIRPYKGIQSEPDTAETESIRGLISDLREDEQAAAVKTLGLESVLEKLEYANESFAEVKKDRIKARQAKALQVTTEELRKQADEMLKDIQDIVRASGIIASLTEGQTGVVTQARNLINDINGITRTFKTSWKQSEGHKKPEIKPVDPDSEQPEEPEEEEGGEGGGFEPIPAE